MIIKAVLYLSKKRKLFLYFVQFLSAFSLIYPVVSLPTSKFILISQNYLSNHSLNDLLIKGMEKGIQGDYQKAIIDFTKVIRLSPYDIEAYYNRGIAYEKINYNISAIADFDKAIRLNSNMVDIYIARANVSYKLGHLREAITDLKTAKILCYQQKNKTCYQETLDMLDNFQTLKNL
ncbi:MAG: tetratricopeptide repeat protein [Candidatus Atelocyanobacterium thalassa isolate SIO64986]|uniref:Tetratricopeptide repeat protein n=1 Tax=Candidatus Atelocyanobacterium thalassa isolate SIO64986 TaxID=1527444 RepID=A0A086CGD6_9CHRO|nr:MAG: tetratricopeptide repeat protein [Candidatus Atelocyanobacterium thalassa isolate SIO64986]